MSKIVNKRTYIYIGIVAVMLSFTGCKIPGIVEREANKEVTEGYANAPQDTVNAAKIKWKDYFTDPNLNSLIDLALQNNQELNITLQEIRIARSEVKIRKGEYLPFVGLKAGAGVDKVARYTSMGASEATTDIEPGREMPDPLQDYMVGAYASWEIDVWGKLHNAKKAAVSRYLASVEGKNFVVTNLIAEIANSYYELLALDNQLAILERNIAIQDNAFKIVKLQKESARVTELAVKRFEAQLLKTKSLQYNVKQQIVETENRIN